MLARSFGALGASAWAGHLRQLRGEARRVLVFALLTLSGLWRSFALALDGFLRALDRDWHQRSGDTARGLPRPARVALRTVAWLAGMAAAGAAALSRPSAAHLRLAQRVDARLSRFAA